MGIVGDGVDADSDVEGEIIRVILAHILKSTLFIIEGDIIRAIFGTHSPQYSNSDFYTVE